MIRFGLDGRLTGRWLSRTPPHGPGTIRYIEVVQREEALYYYYEYSRPDGSHELRANRVVF